MSPEPTPEPTPEPVSPGPEVHAGTTERIGYVLKMYPRFSETFVVSEILAREARGTQIEILSLRPPVDPRFHDTLARVQAPVTYVPRARKAEDLWASAARGQAVLPRLPEVLPELLRAEASDAAQALEVAVAAVELRLTHLHAHFASLATTVARLASLLSGVPYSFTAHAKDLFHADVVPADIARKITDADHVVTVSEYNLQHLRERYPEAVAATPVHRIYNGLDLPAFDYVPPAGRMPHEPTVVAVGRLVEKKGFDVLIDAIAALRDAGRGLRCRIVGGGMLEAELRAQVRALRLDALVDITGPLPQDRVRAELAAADVLAAPCVVGSDGNADGLPTVLLEAMALGTPCITTDVTGIGEAVRHGSTGLQVPQHDHRALATGIARLLDDAALRSRLAGAARALVEAEFDSAGQAARLEAVQRGVRPAPVPVVRDDALVAAGR
ncbi:glycosyltransferase family 4 protein [Georgenia halophila]|uniref:Glycosyltransferase family 4 protein n=1 Tax=Georgenia halophila TaxID=620889 RepID=A0ABP8LNR9_9MICO